MSEFTYGVRVSGRVLKDAKAPWKGNEPFDDDIKVVAADPEKAKASAEQVGARKFPRAVPGSIKAHYAYSMDVEATVHTPTGAKAAGYATYNGCPHVCLDAKAGENLTVAIKLPDGKCLTVAVVHAGKDKPYAECVDISLTGTGKEWDNNGTLIPEFHSFRFKRGQIVGDTRKDGLAGTVVVLTSPEHYKS